MKLHRYLHRIGWSGPISPTRDVLGSVLRAHTHKVPFENLDIQLGIPVTNSVSDAYDKIVRHGRGGWCYEQNGVFGWALSEMGFSVQRVAAAVLHGAPDPAAAANHLTLLVDIPGDKQRWLVDVGFGGGLQDPIPLHEAVHHHSPFDVGLTRLAPGRWAFFEKLADQMVTFEFDEYPPDAGDIAEQAMARQARHLQTSSESMFFRDLVCQLRSPGARLALRGRVYTQLTGSGKKQQHLTSADELVTVLHEVFGLDVPRAHTLWDKICQRHSQRHSERRCP